MKQLRYVYERVSLFWPTLYLIYIYIYISIIAYITKEGAICREDLWV